MATMKDSEIESTREDALKFIKPGSMIYTELRHVSASGMRRRISCFVVDKGEIRQIDWWVTRLTGYKSESRKDGLVVNGCGMDAGYELVYALGRALWPKGTDKPHGSRNGQPDSDGGYALKHTWL